MYVTTRRVKRYGFHNFLFDCVMIVVTGGLWIIWMMFRRRRYL